MTSHQEPRPGPALAFPPLHKRALATAFGVAAGLVTFVMTTMYLLRDPQPGFDLGLLAQYFTGYSLSWRGAFIGAAWAGLTGFVLGWFLAFVRNLVIALILFAVRTRAELDQTRDFLDHI